MQWETKKLEDVADFYLGKMLDKKKNKGDYRPYLANVNVRWGGFELDDLREMRFEDREKERYGLEYGDIVMCEGGEPGRCAIWKNQIPGMMFQKALHRIRPNATLDYRFLYYSFLNRGQEGGFDQYCTGATIKHLPRQNLAKVEVPVPPLETQQAIASILSAYDDLIENNTRRIEILEEMARRLYEEWFVHFRFPGHEEGENKWRTVPFASVLSKHIGGGWGKEEADTQHVEPGYVIRGTDIPGARRLSVEKCPYRFHKASNIKTRRLNPGNIVMEVSGGSHDQSVGRALYVSPELLGSFDDAVICASFCKRLVVDQTLIHPLLVYYHLDEAYRSKRVDEFQVQSTGIKNFQFKPFLEKEVVSIPPQDLQEKFVDMISPVIRQHQNLSRKNANLRAQRDLLLPKLVSGEIDVSDIPMPDDKEVEAA